MYNKLCQQQYEKFITNAVYNSWLLLSRKAMNSANDCHSRFN